MYWILAFSIFSLVFSIVTLIIVEIRNRGPAVYVPPCGCCVTRDEYEDRHGMVPTENS